MMNDKSGFLSGVIVVGTVMMITSLFLVASVVSVVAVSFLRRTALSTLSSIFKSLR